MIACKSCISFEIFCIPPCIKGSMCWGGGRVHRLKIDFYHLSWKFHVFFMSDLFKSYTRRIVFLDSLRA
jgi:hypothetical protein